MARPLISRTPFGDRTANIYDLALSVETEHAPRLNFYRRMWRMYDGDHWDWSRSEDEPLTTINYMRAFVDMMAFLLFANGFKPTVPDDPSTEADEKDEREFVRRQLVDDWEENDGDLVGYLLAQTGGVSGDAFARVAWAEDGIEGPYPKVDVVPSQFVFPEFGGPHGVHRTELKSLLIVFPRYKSSGKVPQTVAETSRRHILSRRQSTKVDVYAERWFPNKYIIYDNGEETTKLNPYGEIPVVHIANFPLSGEYFGLSDIVDVWKLQRAFNEKVTNVSDVIDYQGSPITLVTGAKIKDLERGGNRVWGLPDGATVQNLGLSAELSSTIKFMEFLQQAMHDLTMMPASMFSGDGSGASGAALALKYWPLIQRLKLKRKMYRKGLRNIQRLMLKARMVMEPDFRSKMVALPERNRFRNDVAFEDPMPRDETLELGRAEKRLELRVSSRRREMEKMGMTQREITRVEEENDADNLKQAEMEFKVGQSFGNPFEDKPLPDSGNPDPDRPDPDAQGEAKSINAQRKASDF